MAMLGGPMGPMMRSIVPTRPKPKRGAAFGSKSSKSLDDVDRDKLRMNKRKASRKGPPRGGHGR